MDTQERYNLLEGESVVREKTYNGVSVAEVSCRYYNRNVYRVEGGTMEEGTCTYWREMKNYLDNN